MTFKKEQAKSILISILNDDISVELHIKILNLLADISSDPIVSNKYYKKALGLSPQNVDKAVLAELYYKYAIICEDMNEDDDALIYYKKCIELKDTPFLSGALSNLALFYDDIGESSTAIKYYKES